MRVLLTDHWILVGEDDHRERWLARITTVYGEVDLVGSHPLSARAGAPPRRSRRNLLSHGRNG